MGEVRKINPLWHKLMALRGSAKALADGAMITENVTQRLHLPKQILIQSVQFYGKTVHDGFKPDRFREITALAALYISKSFLYHSYSHSLRISY